MYHRHLTLYYFSHNKNIYPLLEDIYFLYIGFKFKTHSVAKNDIIQNFGNENGCLKVICLNTFIK